jgi:DNA-binding CsgD family transcriptional regulator
MSRDEAAYISELIGDIYDAALDPDRWVPALEKTCHYVGGIASALQSHDILQQNACFYYAWNDNPEFTRSYAESYVRINPAIVPSMIQTRVGEVSAFLDFIPLEEYRQTKFYKEWSAPQGYIDAVQTTLEKSATSYAGAAVMRHERDGPVDDGARRRMGLLAPHFRRAVTIGKVIELHKVEAATLADTFDGLGAGAFLVAGSGCIVHANAAGQAMLVDGAAVRMAAGKLTAADAQADLALHDAFMAAEAGDHAIGVKGIAVPITRADGERWVAHVLPLTSGARRKAGVSYSAAVAVFVRKAAADLASPLETLAAAYRLTVAETRVLTAIVQVGGVPEVAPVLGLSENTVKTHLHHVFEKTGTSRQAELVKLVAGFMNPLGC